MKNQSKNHHWERHVSEFESFSGSIKSYCAEHSLNRHTFCYWKKKLSSKPVGPKESQPSFIPVKVTEAQTEKVIKHLPDPVWVAQLILHLSAERDLA